MKTWVTCVLCIVPGFALVGCAGTTFKKFDVASESEAEQKDSGIRFYEATTCIVVYPVNAAYKADVVQLPDTSAIYSVAPYNLLALNRVTLHFDKGVFSGADTTTDTTAVPKAILSLAKAAALRTAMEDRSPSTEYDVRIYRLGLDEARNWRLYSAEKSYGL